MDNLVPDFLDVMVAIGDAEDRNMAGFMTRADQDFASKLYNAEMQHEMDCKAEFHELSGKPARTFFTGITGGGDGYGTNAYPRWKTLYEIDRFLDRIRRGR